MNWLQKLIYKIRMRHEIEDDDAEMMFTGETELNYDRDPFLHSLNTLGPEDIALSAPPRKRTRAEKTEDFLRSAMMFVCLAVCVGSCIMLVDNLLQKEEGTALYDAAAAEFAAAGLDFGFDGVEAKEDGEEGAVARVRKGRADMAALSLSEADKKTESSLSEKTENAEDKGYNEQLEKLRATLRSYKERNEDVYGYISIPAVGIEYIMVQGEDNDYYLDNNWLKEYLVIGSIFVDYRCDDMIMRNFNTVIYGHNITTNGGSMFNGVTKFSDPEIFEEALIYIYTMDGVYIYKPYSFYDTKASSGYIRTGFTSKQDFVEFAADMKSRSRHASDLVVGEEDRIITLSTCTSMSSISGDSRYALHAVLVEYIV
ncbi:MAG: class B sortase [Clostridia bacterium]|nr:class B sortase [Clostridia bacterium]